MVYRQVLKEYRWKKAKAQRALELYEAKFQNIRQRLANAIKRQEENTQVFEILSPINPLKRKVEDELYRGRIRIQKLEARLEKYSEVKRIKLQLRFNLAEASVKIYEQLMLEDNNKPKPLVKAIKLPIEKEMPINFPLYVEEEEEALLRAG